MKDALAIAVFLGLLPLVVAAVRRAAARWELPPEVRRKAVHIGLGLSVLSFPWIFDSVLSVALLAALSLLVLVAIRRLERARAEAGEEGAAVLHGVGRDSLGDLWFPLAVVVVFAWSRQREGAEALVLYLVPILVLTLADAAGALVGTRYGANPFTSLSGWKSAEGCVSVFVAAFFSAHVPLLLLTETGRAESLLIACILAMTVMLFEAISTKGLDNLVVPLASLFLLDRFLPMDAVSLGWRLVVATLLLAFVLACRKGASLEGGALLAAALFGYGCWALGGWRFLVPPMILFLEHLLVTHRLRRVWQPRHDLVPVLGFGLSLIVWPALAAWLPQWGDACLAAFVGGTVSHLAMINLGTRVFVARRRAIARMKRLAWLKGVALIGLPSWLLVTRDPLAYAAGLAAVALVARLALEGFVRLCGNPESYSEGPDRWWRQGPLAVLAGAAVLVLALKFLPAAP